METYELNTTNPLEQRAENWRLTARSDPYLGFFYLGAMYTAMTDLRQFLEDLPEGRVISEPRSDSDALHDLYAFDALPDLDALAEAQGVSPTTDVSDLATDDWPEDESVEDFIAAAMEGRHEEDEPES